MILLLVYLLPGDFTSVYQMKVLKFSIEVG
jgi:hypothetical protein